MGDISPNGVASQRKRVDKSSRPCGLTANDRFLPFGAIRTLTKTPILQMRRTSAPSRIADPRKLQASGSYAGKAGFGYITDEP